MNQIARRIECRTWYAALCSYCGREAITEDNLTREQAAIEFWQAGWKPHPRDITKLLCQRCGVYYPDFRSIDRDIETEIPF